MIFWGGWYEFWNPCHQKTRILIDTNMKVHISGPIHRCLSSTAERIFSWVAKTGGGTCSLERTVEQTGLEIKEELAMVGHHCWKVCESEEDLGMKMMTKISRKLWKDLENEE
jgi:hypothetical protein